ncbi:Nuclear transport factor 2 (NTF2) family protein [Euphorbia peplus]|nr:Nuclear transport factor 2 (NTF2) family protein [Euphorbia peplus]
MASIVNFPGLLPNQTIRFTSRSIPIKISPHSTRQYMNMKYQRVSMNTETRNNPFKNQRFNLVKLLAADSDDVSVDQLSAASVIKRLYTCVNEKNLKEIKGYISDDSCFEDCSFVSPIQGKKEIMQFYQQLTTSMGQNVKFSIEHICENDEFTAGVDWHLEWKNRHIPFTRGCSFYECSTDGNRLVIKKARVVIESPIKPGGLVLILLKNVTAIFDDFPNFAEWFLTRPYAIVQFITKIYNKLLAPIANPILSSYIRIWNFMARIFALGLSMLLYISKTYFQ